ncbi:flavoprotein [Desulfoscipio sp. XC116]|uniref:flavoprotein n=1 Tax=Desulfoscipio sp. XC116 TaxID=3144975 RepID=UPI00325BC432
MTDQNLHPKVAWGITGAGHYLSDCIELLTGLKSADIFLSDAGKEVLNYYGWYERLISSGHSLIRKTGASCLPVTRLYTGKYDLVIIAPVTSNTIAKMACGIADNLITNLFAHAGKCRIPTILLPCDSMAEMKSLTPQGKQVLIHTREIDRENIVRLSNWRMVTLVDDPQQLKNLITRYDAERQG